jgi:hypothetical protein
MDLINPEKKSPVNRAMKMIPSWTVKTKKANMMKNLKAIFSTRSLKNKKHSWKQAV